MNAPNKRSNGSANLLREALKASSVREFEKALRLFKEYLPSEPDNPELHNELGVAYYHLGRRPEASTCFARATELKPDFARAWVNLGACFNDEKDNSGAIDAYRKALATAPNMADAWSNLGKAWSDSEEFEMAVYCYRRALELKPRGEVKRGLAKAYRKAGRFDRAETLLRQVIAETPEDADSHFGLALTLLHRRQYPEAIAEFEWRMKTREMLEHQRELYPIFEKPAFAGQDLSQKTLLLHTEQGFGDNLQFARFVHLVRPKVKQLVMWCRPGLGALFQHNLPIDSVSENVFDLPHFDYHLPLLSVPSVFDPALDSLEGFQPYLSSPIDSVPRLPPAEALNVGLVWGASDSGFDHGNKKVPLHRLEPLLRMERVQWHSLQLGSDREDLLASGLRNRVVDHGESVRNFLDTAAVIQQLDMVVTCDTAVAHLAGAMGKPVWVMLKKEPDWRWGSDGDSTPWYPTARLFRQQSHGDWRRVVERLGAEMNGSLSVASARATR